METEQKKSDEQFWKEEIKKHWEALILCVAAIVFLVVIAVVVFTSYVQASPVGNYGAATFDQWSLDGVVTFVIWLILWELLCVGVPAIVIFGLGWYLWWQRIPSDERATFKERQPKTKTASKASGGFGLFMFIAYCIYIAINGNYSAPFGSQPYSYWIFSYLWTVAWLLIIIGIPVAIAGLVYLIYWLKKP